jgi:hypothetical protein
MVKTTIAKARVDEKIAGVKYASFKHLMICIIELNNGFFVVGHYAPLDAANVDVETSKKLAYQEAHRQVFALEAYVERERSFLVEKKRKAKEAWEALVRRMMQRAYPVRTVEPAPLRFNPLPPNFFRF